MQIDEWTTFKHPHKAYTLKFPKHWEHRVEKDGEDCGFGPYERDNVGLWISILPASMDSARIAEHLPEMFEESLKKTSATRARVDESIRHHAMKADATDEDRGGCYWIVAGGDLILFASTQVPPDEREQWNPLFDEMMSSLEITRDDALFRRRLEDELIAALRKKHPDQDYKFVETGIRGANHHVYTANIYHDCKASPARQSEIIQNFVERIDPANSAGMGYEAWEEVRELITPVLKPRAYIRDDGPTKSLFINEWLDDTIIVYAIRGEEQFRFVTGWDVDRWSLDPERFHNQAIENLADMDWPTRIEGARQPGGGRLVIVDTGDSFAASRLLHPDFHRVFSKILGSPFLAGIPNRDTLVAFSNRRSLKKKIVPKIQKDHDTSSYAVSRKIYLVTADGVAHATR